MNTDETQMDFLGSHGLTQMKHRLNTKNTLYGTPILQTFCIQSVFHLCSSVAKNLCFICVTLWLLIICGCREQDSRESSVVLVEVNGRGITQADFDDEAVRRPNLSPVLILSNLVERQAMLIRAEQAGLANSPTVKRAMEDRLIAEWIATTYQKERDVTVTVTEEELESAFNARQSLFTRPPLARYAVLYRRGRNTAELTEALTAAVAQFNADREAVTNNGRLPGFGKIAADHSEDVASRYRGGDIGWVGADTASRVPPEVLAAGQAVDIGAIAGPMTVNDGVYVIMKTEEREATRMSFKEAAPALRQRLLAEKRAAVESRFKRSLMEGVRVVHKAAPVAPPVRDREDAPPTMPPGF